MKIKKLLAVVLAVLILLGSFCDCLISLTVSAADTDQTVRYNVLVLDNSGTSDFLSSGVTFYTAGTAIEYVRKAALKFISDIRKAKGKNYVALVTYNSESVILSEFTQDYDALAKLVANMKQEDTVRSIQAGLSNAKRLLDEVGDAKAKKNVILLTTGMTNCGKYSYSGAYDSKTIAGTWYNTSTNVKLYAYSNSAIATARTIDAGDCEIYSVGVFQTMYDIPDKGKDIAAFFRIVAEDLATDSDHFFSADNPEELEFVFGSIVEAVVGDTLTGKFRYLSFGYDYQARYYFETDYFSRSSVEYNASLGTMSLCFAMSAFGSYDYNGYEKQYMNAYYLLESLGFENIQVNDDFKSIPHEDTMGVIAGYREITVNDEQVILLAAATRGAGYESEWAGNATLGLIGRHEGFNRAATVAKTFLTEYAATIPASVLEGKTVKFWITGYSRGAATANLVAADITKDGKIGNISLSKENIYAYCFEPPMGENVSNVAKQEAASYTNIHNIINSDDLVTRVAMGKWGFMRYGTDEYVIPAITTIADRAQYEKMMKFYKELDTQCVRDTILENGDHVLTEFQAKEIALNIELPSVKGYWAQVNKGFLMIPYYCIEGLDIGSISLIRDSGKSMATFQDDLIADLCAGFLNRAYYSETIEPTARNLISILEGGESAKIDEAMDIFKSNIDDNIDMLIYIYVFSGRDEVITIVESMLINALIKSGINIEGYIKTGVAVRAVINSAARTIVAALITSGGDDLVTLAYNYDILFSAHYPELILAWMMSYDKNYTSDVGQYFTQVTRVIRINCPVDVEIVDQSGKIVGSIIDDKVCESENSLIQVLRTSDGEKIVYLPADAWYRAYFTATGSGAMNVSIDEYDYETGSFVKIVNYYDVPIEEGDVYSTDIGKNTDNSDADYTNGLNIEYKLMTKTDENWVEYGSPVVLTGEKAAEATYAVSVDISNENSGFVNGGGNYPHGAFATVSALAYEDCKFVGWYDGETLVSSELSYRFRVEKNVTLKAVFEGERFTPGNGVYQLNLENNSTGYALGNEGYYVADSVVEIKAVAAGGYVFSHWKTSESGYFDDILSEETKFHTGKMDTLVTAVFVPTDDYCPHTGATAGEYTANSCTKSGLIEAVECPECKVILQERIVIPATGHRMVDGKCTYCGYNEKEKKVKENVYDEITDGTDINIPVIIIIASASAAVLAVLITVLIVTSKKKKKRES